MLHFISLFYTNFIVVPVSSLLFSFKAFMKGIEIGNNIKVNGGVFLKRKKGSRIKISSSCQFNSSATSNLIGINHKCIISTLSTDAELLISERCGFSGTTIGAFKSIKIGKNVRCGANTIITDSDWHLDDYRVGEPEPVVIEDNVWLGVNSMVLKGVTIGENSIIGAGSVVTKSIPANVIAAGNPAKIIKPINVR